MNTQQRRSILRNLRTPPKYLERFAWHEAAHAVAMYRLGQPIASAHLYTERHNGTRRVHKGAVVIGTEEADDSLERSVRDMVIDLVGPIMDVRRNSLNLDDFFWQDPPLGAIEFALEFDLGTDQQKVVRTIQRLHRQGHFAHASMEPTLVTRWQRESLSYGYDEVAKPNELARIRMDYEFCWCSVETLVEAEWEAIRPVATALAENRYLNSSQLMGLIKPGSADLAQAVVDDLAVAFR